MRQSIDISRSAWTPAQSRRHSAVSQAKAADQDEKKHCTLREGKQVSRWAEEMKESLLELGNVSTSSTQRLDETYYSVLEKMRVLQNTIAALKDLAKTSRETCESFERDSQGVESDILTQLNGLGQFSEQEDKISSLHGRITAGREKVQSLSHRVDVVRDRIESWERADREWQDRTRRRLRILWFVISMVAAALIALMMGPNHGGTDVELGVAPLAEHAATTARAAANVSRGGDMPAPSHFGSPGWQTCQATP